MQATNGAGLVRRAVRRRLSSAITDYGPFLSARALARRPSAIRALTPLLREPGMISLGAGAPNAATFPFESVRVTLRGGLGAFDLEGDALDAVLQYGSTPGDARLVGHLSAVQAAEHGDAAPSRSLCVTNGSAQGLGFAFDLFTSGGDRDAPVLVEAPTFSGSLAYLCRCRG